MMISLWNSSHVLAPLNRQRFPRHTDNPFIGDFLDVPSVFIGIVFRKVLRFFLRIGNLELGKEVLVDLMGI